jgi:hypothetical protein
VIERPIDEAGQAELDRLLAATDITTVPLVEPMGTESWRADAGQLPTSAT